MKFKRLVLAGARLEMGSKKVNSLSDVAKGGTIGAADYHRWLRLGIGAYMLLGFVTVFEFMGRPFQKIAASVGKCGNKVRIKV